MSQRITRRAFARTTLRAVPPAAATLGAASIEAARAAGSPQPGTDTPAPPDVGVLEVRPYQVRCSVCRSGEGRGEDLGDARLNEILAAARRDRKIPIRLRCNCDTVYRYQNPGANENTPEGELFNAKRDLDVIQKLGLVPGDARPAVDMFERLLLNVSTATGICGYEKVTGDTWRGCARAASGN